MPNYKKVNEGIVDRFLTAVFKKIGSGVESRAISVLKKKDPELAKQMQKIQDARKDLEKTLSKKLSSKEKKQIANNEIPDFINQYLK
tara:strand:+ start:236 stop:496 length:261 start_codon:yes stop_codon:yes gene_type:complete